MFSFRLNVSSFRVERSFLDVSAISKRKSEAIRLVYRPYGPQPVTPAGSSSAPVPRLCFGKNMGGTEGSLIDSNYIKDKHS